MANEHEFEDEEFDELDEDLPADFGLEAAVDTPLEPVREAPAKRLEMARQRLELRGETEWLREQLSDWDDWDESIDAR